MAGRVDGKVVLVTGAAQGIGRAAALALRAGGARVIATDRDASALARLSESAREVESQVLDVTSRTAIEAVAGAAPFDALVNCAGIVHHGTILDSSEEDWHRAIDVNVTSMFRTIRALLPGMLERGRGSIVNVASVVSSIVAAPNRCAYGASKAAVIGLTKAVAADYVARGIRCNALCPGTVDSPSLQARMRATGDYAKARSEFVARQAMQRLGTPDEIAAAIVYLVSDESSFMTGSALVIDGGMSNL